MDKNYTITSIIASIIIILGILFSSCDFFNEPEPFVNDDVRPIERRTCILENYLPNQVVAGNINPLFIHELDSSRIDYISLYLDTVFISSVDHSPFLYNINTRNWPDGKHTLYFLVYLKEDSLGLLNLYSLYSYVYTTTLIIDNTPIVAPSNFSLTIVNNQVYLSWTPTNNTNFSSYFIRRDGNLIATLDSQGISSFTDSTYVFTDYGRVFYDIGVSRGINAKYTVPKTINWGEALFLGNISASLDGFDDRVFFQANELISISTKTCEVLSRYALNDKGVMAKSLDGKRFYFWHSNLVTIFDLLTLNKEGEYDLGWGNIGQQYVVELGELIYATYNNGLCLINSYGVSYGQILGFNGPGRFISLGPQGNPLLAVDNEGIKKYIINITNNPSHIDFVQQSLNIDKIGMFRVDWGNSRIFITRQNTIVEVLDTLTLNPVSSFQLSTTIPPVSDITALTANARNLYVAYTVQCNNVPASIVVEYNIATREQTRSWSFTFVVQSLLGSENGRYLFACTSGDQWVVDIGGPL